MLRNDNMNILTHAIYAPNDGGDAPVDYRSVGKMLGIKGLRYKDEATLLALAATKRILDRIDLDAAARDRTAVIVSSNTGNLDTVAEVAQCIATSHVDETSAMALPNASSNALAATLSIVFQLRGPNLMVCSGADGGLDALELATELLASGRADHALVLGVEVDNEAVRDLLGPSQRRFHGAAAVLVSRETRVGATPIQETAPLADGVAPRDIHATFGDASGATGLLQLIRATEAPIPAGVTHGDIAWQVAAA